MGFLAVMVAKLGAAARQMVKSSGEYFRAAYAQTGHVYMVEFPPQTTSIATRSSPDHRRGCPILPRTLRKGGRIKCLPRYFNNPAKISKLHRSSNPQTTPRRNRRREMLRVMSQKPVRLRLHRRQQHRHIGGMANQPPIRHHRLQPMARAGLLPQLRRHQFCSSRQTIIM
jgi:hypothetical protein